LRGKSANELFYSETRKNLAKKVGKVKVKVFGCKDEFRHLLFSFRFIPLNFAV